MLVNGCAFVMPDGRLCRAAPRRGATFCFLHDPATEAEAAEAQRLGGMRRKRERTIAGAYDFAGLDTIASIRRLLEIAAHDALGLEASIARLRVLVAVALAAARLLEVGELEARLATLEAALASSLPGLRSEDASIWASRT